MTGLPLTPAPAPMARPDIRPPRRGGPPARIGGVAHPPAPAGHPTRPHGHRRHAMLGRLIKAALIAIVLAAIIQLIPDIKRYLEIRKM